MRAAVLETLGEPPRYAPFAEPEAHHGEVLVQVRAAGLHPIVKAMAAGSHYAAGGELPMVPGLDGVGTLEDGQRVFFGFARRPWGTMCERTIALRERCVPVPEGLDDAQAAALPNPGMSAWLSIKERAEFNPGETILIAGATGVAGRLAVQVARHLGAGRIIGTGRNVASLADAGLDAIIDISQPDDELRKAYAAECERGLDVIIDYLWGRPTELLLEVLAANFKPSGSRPVRLVEVGDMAGKKIALAGATLRSVDLRLRGSGFGSVSLQRVLDAIPTVLALAARGELKIDVDPTPLSEVETAWNRKTEGRRIVFTI